MGAGVVRYHTAAAMVVVVVVVVVVVRLSGVTRAKQWRRRLWRNWRDERTRTRRVVAINKKQPASPCTMIMIFLISGESITITE